MKDLPPFGYVQMILLVLPFFNKLNVLCYKFQMTSLSGFPDYQSPEMIANDQGYGTETDLWSLGCVLYECLIGKPPFSSSDPDPLLTAWNVLHYEEHFQFPRECPLSSEAEDLIRCLLTDSDRRINFSGMKAHKFFQVRFFPLKSIIVFVLNIFSGIRLGWYE